MHVGVATLLQIQRNFVKLLKVDFVVDFTELNRK